jgi:hypothetical protein
MPRKSWRKQDWRKRILLNSIAIGGINLIFTFVGLYLIDRLVKKILLIIGSLGYIASFSLVAWAFYAHANPQLLLIFILLFSSHAVGQEPLSGLSEIFPNKVRATGTIIWHQYTLVFAAIITLITPVFPG